jgi:hypothetical protein
MKLSEFTVETEASADKFPGLEQPFFLGAKKQKMVD